MRTSPHRIDHFLVIFFSFVVMELCISGESYSVGVCKEEEKQALLCFMNESKIPTNWVNTTDCCSKWKGVVCDNVTGHVIEVSPVPNLAVNSSKGGKLSSCLLELKQLRHLDLSYLFYYFESSHIPSFIGSFTNLEYLHLSSSGFHGIIPHQLGNLSSLHTLRLRSDVQGYLFVDNLDWLSNLSNLEYLDLTYVNLSKAHNWQEVVGTLPSLHELYLGDCNLLIRFPHPSHLNISASLQVLDLFGNSDVNSVIPRWIFNLNNLVSLDLSDCGFLGPFPNDHWNLTSLRGLDISFSEMSGSIPSQLFGLSNLKYLNLCNNQFQGPLPNGRWNMTSLEYLDVSQNSLNSHIPDSLYHCTNLKSLDMHSNKLQGIISKSISNLTFLSYLYMPYNRLTGEIPKEIGKLKKLSHILFSHNMLYGHLPESIGYLSSLIELSFYSNMLEGIVTESHFVNLTNLRILDAYGNRLILNVSPKWIPPFQLENLELTGWNLGPKFPAWLQSQNHISLLAISNAQIEDEIPTWFWNFSSILVIIDVSHNQLRGDVRNTLFRLPKDSVQLRAYLGSNQFSGPLPRIPVNMVELDLSNNFFSGDISSFLCHAQNVSYELQILLLGGNGLSGKIPDCWMHWPHLEVINVKENQLIGSMPNSTGLLNRLKSLDAHMNMLSGDFPPSLQKCTLLLKLDLGENGFTGKIPTWVGTSLSYLTILRLRSNHFFGELPPNICHLSSLHLLDLADNNFFGGIPMCFRNLTAMINNTDNNDKSMMPSSLIFEIYHESALVTTKGQEYNYDITILKLFASLDLSSNDFSGKIPIELTNLVGLRSLNLSGNNLTGNIPKEMGNMKLLESLDLSKNKLSGEIPSSFSSLSALGVLDLSYNNLSGKIPSGTQLQGFNASCYIGNNLCGLPLPKNCSVDDGQISKHENKGDDDDSEVDWFYVSMAIGFAVGFWVTCVSLLLVSFTGKHARRPDVLDGLARWFGSSVAAAFFSSLERFSCVNLTTYDTDEKEMEEEEDEESKDGSSHAGPNAVAVITDNNQT
ncbi:PREDICTED: receptor-like protein 12 [Ipomoea nil]|uniref:receptor-like protein 12 n=1 Tax=Ipomoea nil TaxID=35883 RepID=UPI0009016313|nr:PREDICTED: receptor-like protein 12 [Ipomoea nil]